MAEGELMSASAVSAVWRAEALGATVAGTYMLAIERVSRWRCSN